MDPSAFQSLLHQMVVPAECPYPGGLEVHRVVQREGGCELQLEAHIRGNMNMGNDTRFLTRVVSQYLPYIGYPRSLNAIAAIGRVISYDKKD